MLQSVVSLVRTIHGPSASLSVPATMMTLNVTMVTCGQTGLLGPVFVTAVFLCLSLPASMALLLTPRVKVIVKWLVMYVLEVLR